MDKKSCVLTFGEIMMRLSPKNNLRIEQAVEFDVRYLSLIHISEPTRRS